MERETAIQKLSNLNGKDLSKFADGYGVTIISNNGGYNKGWPGQVVERHLGGTIDSSKKPDFGDWELKTTALEFKNGELRFKYPMSITMINESDVRKSSFKDSGLLRKLRKMIIATTIWEAPYQTEAVFYGSVIFDLDDNQQIYKQIESDYNLVRDKIRNGKFHELTGHMGEYIQPRTKGPGHGSTSRAFYARAAFLSEFILPLLR